MKEIKYTSDGRKVAVIGSLNSVEKIVQEIFIIDGSEIPSGEHFTVKSLHDAPAISWKEKNLKEIEQRYERDKKSYENEIDRLRADYKRKTTDLRNQLQYVGAVLKNASPDSFNTLVDYLTGNIKWVVQTQHTPKLIAWKDFIIHYEDRLRLISLFGLDDGTLTYAVGDYYDYSGGNKHFIPFNNYEDAFQKFKELLVKTNYSEEVFKIAKQHSIELDAEKVLAWETKMAESLNTNISNYQKAIEGWQLKLSELNKESK